MLLLVSLLSISGLNYHMSKIVVYSVYIACLS